MLVSGTLKMRYSRKRTDRAGQMGYRVHCTRLLSLVQEIFLGWWQGSRWEPFVTREEG
jgi:hypothetical protein